MSLYAWIVDPDVSALVGWGGLVLSGVGLGMTVAVYRSTATIRAAFLVSARVPRQLEELQVCASGISEYLAGEDLHNVQLRREVARLGEIATSIRSKIGSRRSGLDQKLATITQLTSKFEQGRSKERLTDIWVAAQAASEALSQWLKDRDWSNHNG